MKKSLLNLTLLSIAVLAVGAAVSACSGGDDDDDDDGGSRPVVLKAGGGAADFSSCAGVTGDTDPITVLVEVGKQGLDTTAAPAPTPGAVVVQYDPATGATIGTPATTDANGRAIVQVDANSVVAFKVTHPADGATNFVDAYDYSHVTPATTNTSGNPVFNLRIIPEAVRNAIAAILGPPVSSLSGLASFAGTVRDCAGDEITGATLAIGGVEPPRCSSSATLPCVAYSTNTSKDYSDESGQVFVLGLPGTGDTTITVQGLLTEGGSLTQLGSITVRGEADSILLGGIPAQNAP